MTTHTRSHRLPPLLVLALLGLGACGQEPPTAPETADPASTVAAAAVRTVNSLADPGNGICNAAECTLREALKDPAATDIRFALGLSGPITLAPPAARGGMLRIDRSLTLSGPSGGILIRRRSTDPPFRIMRVGAGTTVTLRNLTLRGGRTDLAGGGLINYGTLTLTNCRVTDNESTRGGGGIDNYGPLTVSGSRIARNTAPGGAGIANHNDMTVTLLNSTVTRNTGNGLFDGSGTLVIRHSSITYNSGNGIYKSREPLVLDDVRVVGNAGRGVVLYSVFDATVQNSTIATNSGGGIAITRGGLTITNSTISGNSAGTDYGGGIYAEAIVRGGVRVRLTNSTVSGNSAAVGGGMYTQGEFYSSALVYLVNTTVAFNTATETGGGIVQVGYADEFTLLDLVNALVAKNAAPAAPDVSNDAYAYVSSVHSLIGDGTGSGIGNDGGNLVGNVAPYTAPIDPELDLLDRNGGLTATHALLSGSPAIDAGTAEGCPATDQRGVSRPQGEACDIGSFERQ